MTHSEWIHIKPPLVSGTDEYLMSVDIVTVMNIVLCVY